MIQIRGLIQQMKVGIRNLILEVKAVFKSLLSFIAGIGTPREKEVEIPEAWRNPSTEVVIANPAPSIQIAVEPSIVFKDTLKTRFGIRSPLWFLKAKRTVAFLLLVGSCVSIIGLLFTFPAGLFFTVPTAIINLDYLIKTRAKNNMMRLHILPDLEEEK